MTPHLVVVCWSWFAAWQRRAVANNPVSRETKTAHEVKLWRFPQFKILLHRA
jgi:hypothetical protein